METRMRSTNMLRSGVIICGILLCAVIIKCETKNSTKTVNVVDDDSDFSIALLEEETPAKKGKDPPKDGQLVDSIVKAVNQFTRKNRINLASFLSGGLDGLFANPKPKKSTKENVSFLTKENLNVDVEADDFKRLHDDFFDGDDDERDKIAEPKLESSVQSYVNKIPNKKVLSRQTKSLDKSNNVADNDTMEVFDDDDISLIHNITGVEDLLDVYSAKGMIENWSVIKKTLGSSCRRQMGNYLRGLADGKFWALKMDDASGRYSSGYYWGNGYWAGSATLCEFTSVNKAGKESAFHYNSADKSERAPFEITFFTVKLHLNISLASNNTHIVNLGLCLPEGCLSQDVKNIVELSNRNGKPSVVGIRDPMHNSYDIFSDITFQILVGVSAVISGLILAGTIYEMILQYRFRKLMAIKQLNALKLDMTPVAGLPTVKISNGKSIYNVNGISNNNNNSEERLNIEPAQSDDTPQLSVFSELILSFSVISNMKTICDQSVGSDTIPTIHGLRSMSMVWVILGHSCIVAFKYSDNTELRKVVEKEFFFQTVTNAPFSVDTFFCISGILVSYIYFRTNAKGSLERLTKGTRGFTSGFLQFMGLLGYRFARLTAPYLFMLGVVEISMKWFYYNSVFDPPTQDHVNCPNYWWRNVLYINTLFPVEQMCMLWSWYLADDSQFYVLGAVILILAASHFKLAASSLTLFLISSWATTGYIAWSNNHIPSIDDPLASFDKIYDKPWTRLGPYLIGMATGWLLFKTDCKIRMSKIAVFFGWLISIVVLLSLVYGLYNNELSPITAAAYTSLSHTAWALSIAWIVIACSTGYGGYVNSLLSATILYPFSRVTYCAYLVHPIVIRFLPMYMDHPIHLGKHMMTIIFLGQMVSSYLISFIISLMFEAPVVTMLKILAPNKRKKIQ